MDVPRGKTLKALLYPSSVLGMPLSGVNPFRVVVSEALAKVDKPTLILHGGADSLAPVHHAEANYAALQGPKEMIVFENRNHSEARFEEPDYYFEAIESFLKTYLISAKEEEEEGSPYLFQT